MKKKLLLMLALISVLVCVFAVVVSAETPSLYIEFQVKLSDGEYVPAYTKNMNNASSPKLSFNENFYSDVNFTTVIDKSTIVGIDMSEAVTYTTANSTTGTVKELVSSGTALTSVKEIKFPKASTFTSIPGNFCKNWTSLKTIDFGNTTNVGDNAFQNTAVEEVTIPATMVRMNNQAFYECKQLNKLTFLGATTLGDSRVFANCTALTDVDLGSIPVVQGSMFNGCSSLTSITLPETVTRIGSTAFMGTGLTSLHIPASCTEIGMQMVEGLANFTTITFAENSQLKKISHRAFKDTGLTAIDLPNGIEEIAYSAFEKTALTSIEFPASLKTLSYSVLSGCKSLTSVSFADGFNIENWSCQGMFSSCTALTSVELPACTKVITSNAFEGCSSLETITIPANVTEIGSRTFYGCTALESVDLCNVTTIGDNAFYGCTSLTEIDIPNTVQTIGTNAFRNSGLTGISIPSSVTSIGNYVFHSAKVTSVVFESRTTDLSLGGVGIFQNCQSLTSITLTEGITAIGQDCFAGAAVEEIVIPDSVKSIGSGAFANQSTKRIIISENSQLETMYAFSQAKALESLYLPTGVKIIGGGFYYCYKLQRIDNFENVIMEIGDSKQNTIPTNFFQECPLVEIKLPKTLGTISSGAINGCKALQKIYIPSTVTSIDQSIFNSNLNNTVIFYCGTAENLLSITTAGDGATFIRNRIDAGSVVDYTTMDATYANGVIVENVNTCDAFYAGIHEENDNITLVWLDKDGNAGEAFLSYLKVTCPCGRGCGDETVIETLAPLFVDRGYSYGPNSMLQGVAVDRALLDEYGKYFGNIRYGLVAALAQADGAVLNPDGTRINDYVAVVEYTNREYDLFDMNLHGITENYTNTEFYFGAYLIADGVVYYINNGQANESASPITYNRVVELVDAIVPAKNEDIA